MIIHWHPDGLIYIRKDDWSVEFEGTKEEVEGILNMTLPPLPDGVIERQYFVGKFCRDFTSKGQADELVSQWPMAEEMIERKGHFTQKQSEKMKERFDRTDSKSMNDKADKEQKDKQEREKIFRDR